MLLRRHRLAREAVAAEAPVPDRDPDAYDDLTDAEVSEAYATNVAGNATSRKGQLRALRALDAERSALDAE